MVLLLAWMVGFGALSAHLARQRGRSVPLWILFGAILGPIAVLLVWSAPNGRCPTCDAPVSGWRTVCTWCGNPVGGGRAPVAPTAGIPGAPAAAARPAPVLRVRPAPAEMSTATPAAPAAPPIPVAPALAAAPAPARGSSTRSTSGRSPRSRASRTTTSAASVDPPTVPIAASAGGSPATRAIASGVYLTGSLGLQAGARYLLEVEGATFRIRGPLDVDPSATAAERPLASIDATGYGDRLIITDSDRGSAGLMLGFVALAGGSPDTVAGVLADLADAARRDRS